MPSSNREAHRASGERAHRLGVLVNGLLALLKIAGGVLSGSSALLADGLHSLADLLTNGVAWLSFRVAARPADADHHYGHGKAEAAAGAFVGQVLVLAGLGVLWRAFEVGPPQYAEGGAGLATVVAIVSLLANEWLVRVTRRAARALHSHALHALARDNRSDSLGSVLVLLGIGGTVVGVEWAEPIAAALIGGLIVVMGLQSLRDGVDVLMDRVADPRVRERVRELARGVEGVRGVQRVQVHPLGAELRVDMEISVDGALRVREGHRIAHEVERAVRAGQERVAQVAVHVNPDG